MIKCLYSLHTTILNPTPNVKSPRRASSLRNYSFNIRHGSRPEYDKTIHPSPETILQICTLKNKSKQILQYTSHCWAFSSCVTKRLVPSTLPKLTNAGCDTYAEQFWSLSSCVVLSIPTFVQTLRHFLQEEWDRRKFCPTMASKLSARQRCVASAA